jgi:hypothetical protein
MGSHNAATIWRGKGASFGREFKEMKEEGATAV